MAMWRCCQSATRLEASARQAEKPTRIVADSHQHDFCAKIQLKVSSLALVLEALLDEVKAESRPRHKPRGISAFLSTPTI